MQLPARILPLLLCALSEPLSAQLPFYTDDPAVTDKGTFHFEFFNEFDALQRPQYPNLRQNTANFKFNYGLPHNLELDFDVPHLAIFRATGAQNAVGAGDADMGVKWNFHQESKGSWLPALGASLYMEFPTGDTRQELGSGRHDYWLNVAGQKSVSDKTRVNANIGYLFTGNTSTGALGIQTTRGHVLVGGLSMLHDFTTRLTLGGEIYGGITIDGDVGRNQFQVLIGGQYGIRNGMAFSFGLLGGKFIASPRIGGAIGFSMDFPAVLHADSKK